MFKHISVSVGALLLLCACGGGGGGSTSSSTGSTGSSTVSPADINLSKAIEEGAIEGYSDTASIEDQYLAVINYFRSLPIKCADQRAIQGPSGALTWNPNLAAAALEHSQDMNASGHYGHIGSGTGWDITGSFVGHASSFEERIERNGYTGSLKGENIAKNESKPNPAPQDFWLTVMEGWIQSHTGHCSNIMEPRFEDFGMAEVRGDVNATGWYTTYWTQNFGGS